jgi:hypothetical protein
VRRCAALSAKLLPWYVSYGFSSKLLNYPKDCWAVHSKSISPHITAKALPKVRRTAAQTTCYLFWLIIDLLLIKNYSVCGKTFAVTFIPKVLLIFL